MTIQCIPAETISDAIGLHAEADLDAITKLTAKTFSMPASLISVLDTGFYRFKSSFGIELDAIEFDHSYCALMYGNLDPLIIHDATHDPRVSHLEIARGSEPITFYAGVPILATTPDQHVLTVGSLSVIDFKPRSFSKRDTEQLQEIAGIVRMQLQARLDAFWAAQDAIRLNHALVEQHRFERQFQQAERMVQIGSWHLDLMTGVATYSDEACRILGLEPGTQLDMPSIFQRCENSSMGALQEALNLAITSGNPYDILLDDWMTPQGPIQLRAVGEPEFDQGKPVALFGVVQRASEKGALEDKPSPFLKAASF